MKFKVKLFYNNYYNSYYIDNARIINYYINIIHESIIIIISQLIPIIKTRAMIKWIFKSLYNSNNYNNVIILVYFKLFLKHSMINNDKQQLFIHYNQYYYYHCLDDHFDNHNDNHHLKYQYNCCTDIYYSLVPLSWPK